ncbi:MAG: alpha-L-fucosidase [Verrucomicrobia bacterium]|nr:alpha-L-fucosidase [Verrucomicrobiota bacterium]MCH8525537.1 alpha-L-fucosidase [Kiritimatiellia bacterium]
MHPLSSTPFSSAPEIPLHLKWWAEARYGWSLHFGLYSVAARGEWVRSAERLTDEQYQTYFDRFNPESGWAEAWAEAAVRGGAKYAVLTTKHHDGFCLFDSDLTEFKVPNTPAGRDLVREWVNAVRAAGLRVGLYYSLVDWHHPDCPAKGDRQHPLRDHPGAAERDKACVWERYVDYMHGQLRELCSNYGRIDSLVVDFSYGPYKGDMWGAEKIQRELRALQPDLIFNDRWDNESRKRVPRPVHAGDYEQTEQNLPRRCLTDDAGAPMPWEGWFTLTNSWSHSTTDHHWKRAETIIRALVNCVSKHGNLLLNVSPDARGRIPARALEITRETGEWLELNGGSIYGAGGAPLPKPEWGRWTQKGDTLYAHILEPVIGNISLEGLRSKVSNARLLSCNAEVILADFWNPGVQTFDDPEDIFMNFAKPTASTYPLPDSRDTVVAMECVKTLF